MTASLLKDPAHFLVDVAVSGNRVQRKVMVIIDGDQGITIEDCAKVSRALSAMMDEKNLIEENYTLEVTTPGVDSPLKLKRQYKKNVGRGFKVTLDDKSVVKGTLVTADDSSIQVEVEEKGKKKKESKTIDIPFDKIDKALVQISFK
ncbi:MAG: ribosome maturation factor RimP [Cyclobacteriaceae bacterium]